VRNVTEAVISFIFPCVVALWHSGLKVPCLNLTADKQFVKKAIYKYFFTLNILITNTKHELYANHL
jgi:hypothetical protein